MNMSDATLGPSEAVLRRAMEAAGCHPSAIEAFLRQVVSLRAGSSSLLPEASIRPLSSLPDAEALPEPASGDDLGLDRVAMIKLNGGLGTSMGLQGPKSLLPVHDGLSFLDITLRQVMETRRKQGARLPLLLMNSFNTQAATDAYLAARADFQNPSGLPIGFEQGRVPKLLADSLLPAVWPQAPDKAWCPPGHGEIYAVLARTGLLERLLAEGFDVAFVSNADNLGATLDTRILAAMRRHGWPLLMEATDRRPADRKGGHVAQDAEGRLILRELAQCPASDLEAFQDLGRHRYFNTNNLWLHLPSLAARIASKGLPELPLIRNPKHLVPEDSGTPEVIQLETAMGAAIGAFEGAAAIRVSRRRFRPVKRCSDLLGLWSDAYELGPDGRLELVAERRGEEPQVELDPAFYNHLGTLQAAFPHGAPSLRACSRLSVSGPVRFGRGVRCVGRVTIAAAMDKPLEVPDGLSLEGAWP